MTREEKERAIDLLDNLIGMVEDNQDSDYDFALKKGIEALQKEPCEDCVNGQAMLDAIRNEIIQSINNGTLKIETGNEELFRILDKYKAER